MNNFIDLIDHDFSTLNFILNRAKKLKQARADKSKILKNLSGLSLAMIFEKPSTRTRISFELAMKEMGGNVIVLDSNNMQLGRGETISDTARVLGRYCDVLMVRAISHETLEEYVTFSGIPVINGLTNKSHPCQVMADIMTFEEFKGSIQGHTVSWVGDGNNVLNSWMHAATKFDFKLNIACPASRQPDIEVIKNINRNKEMVKLFQNPKEAVNGSSCVVTDTWFSMGDKKLKNPHELFGNYQVNEDLMNKAKRGAIFMHCLPASRGNEVTSSVMEGESAVIWDEVENRLHIQKAILEWCISKKQAIDL